MTLFSLPILIIFLIIVLCFASYAALYTIRWPKLTKHLAMQEAHELLGTTYNTPLHLLSNHSYCDHCYHALSWKDLIPVMSFLLLKGRCRYCSDPIKTRHLFIETGYLAINTLLIFTCHTFQELIVTSIILCSLLTAAIIDSEFKLIPDECCLLVTAAALFLHLNSSEINNAVLGMILGYSIIFLLRWGYLHLRKVEGIGLGDAKLMAAIGAWLGAFQIPSVLFCASLIGILYIVIIRRHKAPLPFGPLLVLSAIIHYAYMSL